MCCVFIQDVLEDIAAIYEDKGAKGLDLEDLTFLRKYIFLAFQMECWYRSRMKLCRKHFETQREVRVYLKKMEVAAKQKRDALLAALEGHARQPDYEREKVDRKQWDDNQVMGKPLGITGTRPLHSKYIGTVWSLKKDVTEFERQYVVGIISEILR